MKRFTILLGLAVLLLTPVVWADVPKLINFQGILRDGSGNPVADGAYTVRFRIYDDSTTAEANFLWTETVPVQTLGGLFNVRLGDDTPLPNTLFTGSNRFVGVKVNVDPEMSRLRLISVPYALHALRSDSAATATVALDLTCAGCVDAADLAANAVVGGLAGDIADGSITEDDLADNSVGSGEIAAGAVGTSEIDATQVQRRVIGTAPVGEYVTGINQDGSVTTAIDAGASAWNLTGNSGTTPGTNFLGTTDNQALELKVNNSRALRIEPNSTSPNVIEGQSDNSVTVGAVAATIGGGGVSGFGNLVTDDYGTVGGGLANRAGDNAGTTSDHFAATVGGGSENTAGRGGSTVSGGIRNTASAQYTTVAGGIFDTASATYATVGGGTTNVAGNTAATVSGGVGNRATGGSAAIGGGSSNLASGNNATVGGGLSNQASGFWSTISGGSGNTTVGGGAYAAIIGGQNDTATGSWSAVLGGLGNKTLDNYSIAAGRRAKALHSGAFVWGDGTDADFASTAANQFLIRASNVGIGLNNPTKKLEVAGSIKVGTNDTVFSSNLSSNSPLNLQAPAGTSRMYINDVTGSVGIGTTSPSATLHIFRSAFPSLAWDDAGATEWGFTHDGSNLNMNEAGATRTRFLPGGSVHFGITGGSVGIGTSTPANKLDIEGGAAIGATYSGTSAAPANGLLVEGNVGVATTSPNSRLQVFGAIATTVATFFANVTLSDAASVAQVDAAGAARTITLPAAAGINGRQYTLKKIDATANTVTVDPTGAETIDGAATYVLSVQWKYVVLVSNGANWIIVGNN